MCTYIHMARHAYKESMWCGEWWHTQTRTWKLSCDSGTQAFIFSTCFHCIHAGNSCFLSPPTCCWLCVSLNYSKPSFPCRFRLFMLGQVKPPYHFWGALRCSSEQWFPPILSWTACITFSLVPSHLQAAGGQSSGLAYCYLPSSAEHITGHTVSSLQMALVGLQKPEGELMAGVHSFGFRNLGGEVKMV